MTLKITICVTFLLLSLGSELGFADESKLVTLLKRSPAAANAIGYVNVDSLNQLMDDAGFSDRISDEVDEYWFISNLNLMSLRPRWEAGYTTLKSSVSADSLAESLDGYVDVIEDESIVRASNDSYLYPIDGNRLGVLRPADRSMMSKWISRSIGSGGSAFLNAKAAQPESFLSLMLAFEIDGAFSPTPLTKRLETFESIKSKQPQSVAKVLASATGINIIVGRRSLQECILTIDFAFSPASLENIAPELCNEILERSGASAPEVLTWTAKTESNSLKLQGPITESTLSGLLGIFSLGTATSNQIQLSTDGGSAGQTEQEKMAYRSKHYFDEVNSIVEETRKHKSQSTGGLAKWNDQRARKIDELPTLNVDTDMVQFGTSVAEGLRGNALMVTQGNIDAGKTKASQGYYGTGYYDANWIADSRAVTSAYASGNAYADYKQTLSQIDKLTAEVRRAMTQKFQIQF